VTLSDLKHSLNSIRQIEFGGHGYSHIISNIIPKMRTRGFSQEEIDTITIKNPSEWLQF
jgi:phosphotriesterase-related protein